MKSTLSTSIETTIKYTYCAQLQKCSFGVRGIAAYTTPTQKFYYVLLCANFQFFKPWTILTSSTFTPLEVFIIFYPFFCRRKFTQILCLTWLFSFDRHHVKRKQKAMKIHVVIGRFLCKLCKQNHLYNIRKFQLISDWKDTVNPFVPSAPFLYPLENIRYGFLMFSGSKE